MTALRARVLDAAIELLGTQGLKALTHRRIDEKAGLPPGSTSNYYRTRDGLLRGAAEAILERELAGMQATFAPRSAEELLVALVALMDRTTVDQRTLTSARLVLLHGGPATFPPWAKPSGKVAPPWRQPCGRCSMTLASATPSPLPEPSWPARRD
jgi:AcrR family transcriptional regulator